MAVRLLLLALVTLCTSQDMDDDLTVDLALKMDVEGIDRRALLEQAEMQAEHMEMIPGADALVNQVNHNIDPDGDESADMPLEVAADDALQALAARDIDTPCRDAEAIPPSCAYRGHANCDMAAPCTGFGTWKETYECAVLGDWSCVDLCHKCNREIPTCSVLTEGKDCKFLMSTHCGPGCCGVGTAIAQYRCDGVKAFCEKPCCCAHCKNKNPTGTNTGHPKDCEKYLVNPRALREMESMCYRPCDK